MKTTFPIGAIVQNLGFTTKVTGYHEEAGCLILRGYGLRDAGIGQWIADPAKCERLDKPSAIIFPEGALIGFSINAEGCTLKVGTEVVGNWGTCYPQEEGVVTTLKPDEPDGNVLIAVIQWKDEDGQLSSKLTFHPVDTIHKPGWRSPNGSPIGVFLK